MGFSIRLAEPRDLPAVGRITVDAYHGDGFLDAEDDYSDELSDAERRAREAEVWVAADGREVLGSVTYCSPGTPFAELARDNEGEFRMLSVAPTARRQGVAEALVRHCLQRSRDLGHEAVVLCSMRQMATAHRLYERLGFQRLPERDWSPAEGIELLAFILPLPTHH
ncbi:MAG TPA: GNAT family N-acetyltransferase [Nocardioidaceae bacterium]|nr:GNAT family N-acetyltransferase [Nocardioidaceae bacterium]